MAQTLVVHNEVKHDLSAPLREMVKGVVIPQAQPQEAEPVRTIPLRQGFKPPGEPDLALQRTSAAASTALSPTLINNFDGIGQGVFNFSVEVAPPDTNGAVGLTQYVQWVNLNFAIFDKTTGNILPNFPVPGNSLWSGFGGACETNNDGDIIVLYDQLNNRWVFGQFAVRNGNGFLANTFQCVAVSTSSDATGTYNRYAFEFENEFDDYPKMAVWPDAYYAAFNMFNSSLTAFLGADACALDGNAMRNGTAATAICFQQGANVFGLLPSNLDGQALPPQGSPDFMVAMDVNSLDLFKFHVDFTNPSNSTFSAPTNIPVTAFTPLECNGSITCVPQPNTTQLVDSLGDRLMYRLAYRNFGTHESLVVSHSVIANSSSGIRWYEIQSPNTTPVVAQQSTYAPDANFRWMGSMAMDNSGDIGVGYSVSSGTTFPSIAVTGQAISDPRNTLQTETPVVSGTGSQIGLNRWGDYSAIQVDPADDCTFWYTTEYIKSDGSFNWNTRIANFKFQGCGAPDLRITKSHSGNFTQGQMGATYTITVTNVGGQPTDGTTVTVVDTLPTGLTATAISSNDPLWVCTLGTLTCTRSDVLASQASYPAITLTVNVANNAPGIVTNTATVSGGGSKDTTDNTANDPTTIIQLGPDPTVTKTHPQSFPLGQSGAYSITVTNVGLTATSGTITVTDTLPSGLTAVSASGTGWGTCSVAATTVSCSRSDSLASNAAYPPVALVVNVAPNAPSTVVNNVTVSGGGDVNSLNNTATDPTSIVPSPPGMAITSPIVSQALTGSNEFKPGTQIPIAGTATGPTFQDFRMQWAEGVNPTTGWSTAGITLAGGGLSQVTNSSLGTWDTTGILAADYYTLQVLVDNAPGYTNEVSTIVYLEPSLLSVNWPVNLAVAPDLNSGFLPTSDASGNKRLALVTPIYLTNGGIPAQYFSFVPDNSSQTVTNIPQPSYLNPAAGTVEGAPGDDVVIPDAPGQSDSVPEQIQFFRSDNSSFTFSLGANFVAYSVIDNQPVLEDVNGTGELDTVILANNIFNTGFGVDPAGLFAWHPDGTLLGPNFPISIPDLNIDLALSFKPRVVIGDLQGNGNKEFVVEAGMGSSTFTLLLFAHDGTPITWGVPVFGGSPVNIALADLDHNGKLETLLLTADNNDNASLHVFQPDGSERPGFPVPVGLNFEGHIAVGDLNRDGVEEIVVLQRNSNLIVLEPDGTPFPGAWSQIVPNETFLSGPIELADINGDGFPEILIGEYHLVGLTSPSSPASTAPAGRASVETSRGPQGLISHSVTSDVPSSQQSASQYWTGAIIAVDRNANIVRTWNMPGADGNQPFIEPKITVGDFLQNGMTDLAINNFTIGGGGLNGFLTGGVAFVLTTGTPFNARANDWPMVQHDPHNTAVQRRDVTLSITAPVAGAMVSGTIPVTATTNGPVASVQFKVNGANLGSPVTTAPFTVSWDTTQAATNAQTLMAVATDTSGQPIASAPVTVSAAGFDVASSTPSATVTAGNSATFNFTVTPFGGFNQTVNFSCSSGVPNLAQCSFAPPSVTPNGAPVTSVLTISTTAPSTAFLPQSGFEPKLPLYPAIFTMLAIALLLVQRRAVVRMARLSLALAALCVLLGVTSCGGGGGGQPIPQGGTPRGTSQITVTTTAGSTTKTVTVTLVVQ